MHAIEHGPVCQSPRPRILPSCWDGKRVTWRNDLTDSLCCGTVEKVNDRDMVYISGRDGKRYYLPMHKLVCGWITLD